jgi:hypothetical protein
MTTVRSCQITNSLQLRTVARGGVSPGRPENGQEKYFCVAVGLDVERLNVKGRPARHVVRSDLDSGGRAHARLPDAEWRRAA